MLTDLAMIEVRAELAQVVVEVVVVGERDDRGILGFTRECDRALGRLAEVLAAAVAVRGAVDQDVVAADAGDNRGGQS